MDPANRLEWFIYHAGEGPTEDGLTPSNRLEEFLLNAGNAESGLTPANRLEWFMQNCLGIGGSAGYTADQIAMHTAPEGVVVLEDATKIVEYAFENNQNMTSLHAKQPLNLEGYAFKGCYVESIVFEGALTGSNYYLFRNATKLKGVDIASKGTMSTECFTNCAALDTIICRKTGSIMSLANTAGLDSTQFKASGAGGTLYVPSALKSTYESATNWATVLAWNANNKVEALEGSIYETVYYDGVPILA